MTNEELRHRWRSRWLGAIQEFADFEMQQSAWLDPAQANPHFSFIECMNCYFDDLLLNESDGGYKQRVNEGYVSADEAAIVSAFHALAEAYNSPKGDDYDNYAVLCDPDWLRIVVAAQAAQASLASSLMDDQERRWLLAP